MRIVIPALNIRAFGKAIQSLAKIGEEISFEPSLSGLSLKSINSTRSCLAQYDLKPRFFQHFSCGSNEEEEDETVSPRFRVSARGVLNVFKSLSSMDRTVDTCSINLDTEQNRVVFSLLCKHGITKTHSVAFIEGESLNCSLTKTSCANVIRAESKLFSEILSSFPNNLEEMTMLVTPTGVSLRNFIDTDVAAGDPMKLLNTTMTLDQEEFEHYQITSDASISFCLKEMKAAISFAEYLDLSIALYFDGGGQPMFVNMDSDPNFEVTFFASTISESASQQSSSSLNTTHLVQHNSGQNVATKKVATTSAKPPEKPSNKKYIGRLEETIKAPTLGHRDRSHSSRSKVMQSAIIHDNTSEVNIKPKISAIMNDSSITLLPTDITVSKPKNAVDTLLEEIDNDTLGTPSSATKGKRLFFNRSTTTQKRAAPEEVLAGDSDDST